MLGTRSWNLAVPRTTPGLHHWCSSAQIDKHQCSFIEPSPGDTNRRESVTSQPFFFFLNDHWGLWFRAYGVASHKCITSQAFTWMVSICGHALQSRTVTIRKLCRSMCSPSVASSSATPWTATHQVALSMAHSRQECWSCLPFLLKFSRSIFVINIGTARVKSALPLVMPL